MTILNGVHHVAYRCKNAKETVEWYQKHLDANFILAIAENEVPSTKEPDPYMHIFIDIGGGNILAFFELPTKADMIAPSDANTPPWTQHLALKVDSVETMMKAKARLEAGGVEVLGPTDHTLFKSIYFFDPSGHRLELAANTATDEMNKELDRVKWDMLNEWDRTKKAPEHARWMHDGSGKVGPY
ncbi:MAG: VOC family protein [Burkholderiales bacterium]|nr:VOC family protein [Burkholderiales bacterium]